MEVLIPPAILNSDPADGQQLMVKQGSRVKLHCSATGNPTPRHGGGFIVYILRNLISYVLLTPTV